MNYLKRLETNRKKFTNSLEQIEAATNLLASIKLEEGKPYYHEKYKIVLLYKLRLVDKNDSSLYSIVKDKPTDINEHYLVAHIAYVNFELELNDCINTSVHYTELLPYNATSKVVYE